MNEEAVKFRCSFGANPKIAAITAAVAAGLFWAAMAVEDAPSFIRFVLWAIAIISTLITMGALMSTSVTVDGSGDFSMSKTMAGMPISDTHIRAGDILTVELDRQITPGLERASDSVSSSPDRPRYKLVLVHKEGKVTIEASEKPLSEEAGRLAHALERQVKKTGDWMSC